MLILADGFALYGTGATSRTNMSQGVWAQADAPIECSTANPRGHGTHHLRFASVQNDAVRRVLGADYGDGLGFGAAFYFSDLPTSNASHLLFGARDGANAGQYSIILETTGKLAIWRGDLNTGVKIDETTNPVITAGAYQHIEMFAVCGNAGGSPGGGSMEIRVNGQTVYLNNNIDLQNQGTNSVEQFVMGSPVNSPVWFGTMDVADLHCWDTSGSVNNDFLGDVQWLPVFPTADRAAQEWTPSATGDGYTFVDESTPDAEATYIEAPFGSPGAISEFDMTDVPALTSDVVGFVFQPMLRKTDAGDGSAQMSIIQSASSPEDVTVGVDRPLTQVYTYYPEVFEVDPATGVRFTPSGFNSMAVRLQRTA